MSTRSLWIAALLAALPLPCQSTATAELSPAARAIVAESRKDSQVMDHLDYLTNSIGSRLTGSQSLVLACEWVAERLRSFGLENVHLEEWGEVPVSFERGPWFGAMIRSGADGERREVLEFNTPAWSAGTKGLRRGRAVLIPETEEAFAQHKQELKGAWVVQKTAPGRGRGRAQPVDAGAFDAVSACEKAGILGFVRGARDQYLRTSSNREVDWRHLDMDHLPKVAQVQMAKTQFEELLGALESGEKVDLEFCIQNRFRKGPVKLLNVVGDIPGTEFPDEYVLVGGHVDCWDGANGAVDNASGVSTAMEAVRLIRASGVKPRRTIRIAIWSGEEQGLLGSAAYCRAHQDEMERVSAYLNHDSGTNFVSGAPCTKAMRDDLEAVFAGVSEIDEGMPFALREVEGLRGGGSDHGSFLQAGVPAWSWMLTGEHDYGHIWHTQHDLYDEVIEKYQRHSAMVIAIAAVGIANLDHLLSREKLLAAGGRGGGGRFDPGAKMEGNKVVSVEEGSTLARAGLRAGDVILKVSDQEVRSLRDVFMAAFRANGPVKLLVLRDGKERTLNFEIERRRR
ncbi:MAG: hypothetical protein Fur0037_24340 [Planctomycetota bacterium]